MKEVNIGDILNSEPDKELVLDSPVFDVHCRLISLFVWRKQQTKKFFTLDYLDTLPYRACGEIPFVYLTVGRLEIGLESLFLYKRVYKRLNGKRLDYEN